MVLDIHALAVGRGGRPVLHDVTLSMEAGACVVVWGRNGAGKSTLMDTVMGLLPRSAGDLLVCGADPWREHARALAHVAMVGERDGTPSGLSLAEIAWVQRRARPCFDEARATSLADRFGVPWARPIGALSLGQRRLGHFALALAARPRLLLLDDPTLGLDLVARDGWLRALGEARAQDLTALVTTHDPEVVEAVADRVAPLRAGRLSEGIPLAELSAGGPLADGLRALIAEDAA